MECLDSVRMGAVGEIRPAAEDRSKGLLEVKQVSRLYAAGVVQASQIDPR